MVPAQQSDGPEQAPPPLLQQVPAAEQLDSPLELPQQSLPYRHTSPGAEHWHSPVPVLHEPLQHWALSVQPKLMGRQQEPPTHWALPQQLPAPEQAEPSGVQQ